MFLEMLTVHDNIISKTAFFLAGSSGFPLTMFHEKEGDRLISADLSFRLFLFEFCTNWNSTDTISTFKYLRRFFCFRLQQQ